MNIQTLQTALNSNQSLAMILILSYGAGLLVSLTPCLYPMIPITLGILQSQATPSFLHNFLLSLSYVLGIATIYATLGYVVAKTSIIFGSWLTHPWFIVCMIVFFAYYAFSLLGFYEIYTPSFLKNRTPTVQNKGSLLYSFFSGILSGTVASPCATPAIALLLGYAAKLSNPFVGFLSLFSFSLGMGTLLILVGTFSSLVNVLPKTGAWMVEIKKALGIGMLATCVYFLRPYLTIPVELLLYGLLCASAGIYLLFTKNLMQT